MERDEFELIDSGLFTDEQIDDSIPDWYLDDEEYELDEANDGQPDEYTEWQDVYGGDDWDHGQYDEPW